MRADLHMHSTYSDGRLTPLEVIKRAKRNGIDIISITDHDIISGADEIKGYANQEGIRYIPGIELSTIYKEKSVHLLGYFTDESYYSKEIIGYSTRIKLRREERAIKIILKLKKYFDIEISYNEVFKLARGIIARPHIAKVINSKYPEYSLDYIFKNFIGDQNKAYVPSSLLSVQQGIDMLKRNNCVVVLAHPVLLKEHIKDFVLSHQFDGIEAIYIKNTEEDEKEYREYALKNGIIITAGSDYHGIENDSSHGDIGDKYLEGKDLEEFLLKFNK
jgi:predicted metal-dependent phosphoesterase TrpH